MDSEDKSKRFRLHVVKEIYQTEKDYTEALEFTVNHIQSKLRLKAANDNSLTDEVLTKLFSNIDQLLVTHKLLVADLDTIVGTTPSHDSPIAQCYLKHEAGFREYQMYGENNEHAQKILYDLENNQSFKAFFVGLMLLGGKSDVSISSYLFKPIQRICKYPLLFRELLKYTPVDHSDYNGTTHALSMMKDICSVINEAKRRVERLEFIADWQGTVDGWEGSPVIDTCSELVKEGQLVKISAGNIQERVFFLFDTLLVYCKRNSMFPLRAKTEQKPYYFRGRIPVANIEIENIEDGTCDYQTSRVQVNNGWKVRNLAKNKWFVLIAKTPGEKQQWIDAIRSQKDRIERERAGFARETRALMLDKGDKLHRKLVNEGKVLQDHRYRLRSFSKSFTGNDFSKWLIEVGEAEDASEAVRLGQALLENGVIHHVSDRHQFKNSQLIYRFRVDDGTLRLTKQTLDTLGKGLRVYSTLHSLYRSPIRDHRSGLKQMKSSIAGSYLVDWLIREKYFGSREEGVDFGNHLMAIGLLKHISDDQKFKDSTGLYYQFIPDTVGHEQQPLHSMDFAPIATCPCLVLTIPYDSSSKNYNFEMEDSPLLRISNVVVGSQAEAVGLCSGMEILGIGGQYLNGNNNPCATIDSHRQMEAPLEVIVRRESEETLKLGMKDQKLGFQLKGNHPVLFTQVDGGSEAAMAGIIPGCCVIELEGENIFASSYNKVMESIKLLQDLYVDSISLKIGTLSTQHLTHYQYESSDDVAMEFSERVMESPFVFSIPSKLFKLYDEEARNRAKLLSQHRQNITSAIEDYITELQVQADNYRRASNSLSSPRYPSFRQCNTPSSRVIESCPINLHTIVMEVGPSCRNSSSPTPSVDPEGSLASSSEVSSKNYTGYCINTMAFPCLMNRNHSQEHVKVLQNCQRVRELLAKLDSVYVEIIRDSELLQRLTLQDSAGGKSPLLTTLPRKPKTGPRSPMASPIPACHSVSSSSPKVGYGRTRNVSFVNPSPLMKIVLDGIASKISQLEGIFQDISFHDELYKGMEEIVKTHSKDLHSEWLKVLASLRDELASLSEDSDAVRQFAVSIIEKIRPIKKDAEFYLEVALAIYDDVEVTDAWDRLFCHCLVAVVTGFASLLLTAARGHLNHASEYIKDPANASQQWFDLIAARGVLVCFRTFLLPTVASEVAGMKDMSALLQRIKAVTFHIKEQANPRPFNSNLPNVSMSGNHNHLQVTFELPMSLLEYIPESLFTGEAIMLHPVMFNTSLQEIERKSPHYAIEQQFNEESLLELRAYYRGLRQYHLSKAVLPGDAAERTIALQEASRPLTAIDELIGQLEGNIKEPAEAGAQIQVLMAEIAHRMGAVNLLVCDSGVYRSLSCASLEEILLLSRCHGLQSRSFRSALSTLRKTGALSYLEKKNSVEKGKDALKKSPWLYKIVNS